MTYIENVFVCIAAPLLLTAWCMGKGYLRFFLFCFAGMGTCLLAAYLNTFFAMVYHANAFSATAEIAPVVEEIFKLLPVLFYLVVFEPRPDDIRNAVLTVAAGFATFENICYLIRNGAENFGFLLVRGFSTGAMHIVCGAMIGWGLMYVWRQPWLKAAGTCALLGAAITFHGIYNLLVAYGGVARYIACALPLITLFLGMGTGKWFAAVSKKNKNIEET
ncbi:PrsW family glutamic-type intramembrane protease [uncultured Ruthenibacterium sp.]|uniref:PrsW family glutamic-type intramembrane protease n=1 Tax=uncultured Ruthenibacterium sp. TaxID=1905347 RepID=UPI00349E5971